MSQLSMAKENTGKPHRLCVKQGRGAKTAATACPMGKATALKRHGKSRCSRDTLHFFTQFSPDLTHAYSWLLPPFLGPVEIGHLACVATLKTHEKCAFTACKPTRFPSMLPFNIAWAMPRPFTQFLQAFLCTFQLATSSQSRCAFLSPSNRKST